MAELIIRANENVRIRQGKQDEIRPAIDELNERLRRANFPYRYHGGVFQPADDDLSEAEIETPFWRLISVPIWRNVDEEMKNAFHTRANNGVDPAFHAAKALESAIKIVSDERGWSTGKEKGAATYIENLVSKKNSRCLDAWEGETLKYFFTKIRNPMGHGKGSADEPKLSSLQTDWAIEFCMIWIKSIVQRF